MKQHSKTLVPCSELEWTFVKENLMSNDVSKLEHVLDILCIWELRRGSETPIFMLMTKMVVQALLYDYKNCSDASDRSNELNSAAIYGLSLTRFINYANEIAQPKSGNLMSIANAVKQIGIPEKFVHLRHAVAHCEMPSIDELREAAQFCRDWLWEMNYFYPMSIAVINLKTLPPSASENDSANDENQSEKPRILTLENLKLALEERRRNLNSQNNGNWSLKGLSCPLGLSEGQSSETLDLII